MLSWKEMAVLWIALFLALYVTMTGLQTAYSAIFAPITQALEQVNRSLGQ